MQRIVERFGAQQGADLSVRVGMDTGTVTSGLVGRSHVVYDLWGDAVNTASRMESHGTPGRIQITRSTYELVAQEFDCEPRGTIAIKGKGEVEAWFLVGPAYASSGARRARSSSR